MKKTFNLYIVVWILLLALFNIIVFVSPSTAGVVYKFGGAFWSGYIFITLALIGQLICGYFAFTKSATKERLFLNLPFITISYSSLIISAIVGTVCMAVPGIPNWIGIIVGTLVLGVHSIAIIKAVAAAEIVDTLDGKVKAQTSFIKNLTLDAQALVNHANSSEIKNQCQKVYEKLRYSDPMSSDSLSGIEQQIKEELQALTDSVIAGDSSATESFAHSIMILIDERNNKCKYNK